MKIYLDYEKDEPQEPVLDIAKALVRLGYLNNDDIEELAIYLFIYAQKHKKK